MHHQRGRRLPPSGGPQRLPQTHHSVGHCLGGCQQQFRNQQYLFSVIRCLVKQEGHRVTNGVGIVALCSPP